ncbi:helix-turn-helix domain-containing protein [Altererythrobacter sp. RZ02]|uniref:Helix-turn-helix domain-containing protein n=1 Tax=Pontixanthobacter rizhaonensis TaxID=2730337 RepID=A0A848QJ67_9SPHN|nr:helix-turn-helix domain-containing protein [Pontixanthobacter rizhaonensis]NMW30647.1 helix-turn-helix domain-containing protein [Pontixanthobacter rizhaonensis]
MSDEAELPETELPLDGAGGRLRQAREAASMTIEQVAAKTRIPQRHLISIEANDFTALPSRTYAIGFSRTYARSVDVNDQEIADQVRAHLAEAGDDYEEQRSVTFEPGDPARVPSRGLAWFSAFAALLLIVGGLAFFRGYFIPGSGPASLISGEQAAADEPSDTVEGASAPAPAAPSGQVVFTSLQDGVWVKFYDAEGERLMEKQMEEGETYAVPTDAAGPQVWTGQPEALAISIGGQSIGTLSDESQIVRDVDVTADALLAAQEESALAAQDEPADPEENPSE